MYILGNDVAAQSLCTNINDIFDIKGFITAKNGKLYLIKNNTTTPFEHLVGNIYALATTNRQQRLEFLNYFKAIPGIDFKETFPNLFFENTYISDIASIGSGNIFYPNSGLYGTASIGSFNYFFPYSSAQLGSVIGNNNFLYSYSCVDFQSCIEDHNTLMTSSYITNKAKIGSKNLIWGGEVVYENLDNSEYFQSGIATVRNDFNI